VVNVGPDGERDRRIVSRIDRFASRMSVGVLDDDEVRIGLGEQRGNLRRVGDAPADGLDRRSELGVAVCSLA
jgi:hypothetical protein